MVVAAKLRSSMLRYINVLRVDKVFYEAGVACREAGLNDMAFVFFNRLIDLFELIDDPDVGASCEIHPEHTRVVHRGAHWCMFSHAGPLDNGDFMTTDIPYDFPVPKDHFVVVRVVCVCVCVPCHGHGELTVRELLCLG